MAVDNKTLGRFQLTDLPPAPRGVPQIEVKFDIDANGIVNVTAKDLGTNKEQKITITSNTTLSDDEIDKMVKEAEANREEDEKRKALADAKNEGEQMIFATEKAIKDLKDKVEDKEKSDAEEKIKDLKESLEKDDLDDIKKKTEALQEITYALAAKVYQQTAPEENKESSDDNKKDDGVQEAEYEEK